MCKLVRQDALHRTFYEAGERADEDDGEEISVGDGDEDAGVQGQIVEYVQSGK